VDGVRWRRPVRRHLYQHDADVPARLLRGMLLSTGQTGLAPRSLHHRRPVQRCERTSRRPTTSIRLFVLGACLCTMLAYSFFLQSCFVFLMFSRVFKTFLVGLATGRAVVFYE